MSVQKHYAQSHNVFNAQRHFVPVAIDFQHHHFPGGLSFLSFCLVWAGSCRAVFLSKCSRHVVQGVVAVKLVLEEGFFDATCPKIQEEEEACLSCQDVVLNLLSFPQVGNGAIVQGLSGHHGLSQPHIVEGKENPGHRDWVQ